VQSPGWTFDGKDDGMMDHAVYSGCGNDRIAKIIAELFEVDVLCKAKFYAK
jgi:hypothetical protein